MILLPRYIMSLLDPQAQLVKIPKAQTFEYAESVFYFFNLNPEIVKLSNILTLFCCFNIQQFNLFVLY